MDHPTAEVLSHDKGSQHYGIQINFKKLCLIKCVAQESTCQPTLFHVSLEELHSCADVSMLLLSVRSIQDILKSGLYGVTWL